MMFFLSVVLIGTVYPIFLEVVNNDKISIGPPFYHKLIVPFMIPFLIFMATLLFIFNPQNVREKSQSSRGVYQKIGLSFVSTYGGYFNGGLGLALLSVLSTDKDFSLKQLSAIKSLLSLFITLVSVSVFFLNNFIVWSFVFYMMFF